MRQDAQKPAAVDEGAATAVDWEAHARRYNRRVVVHLLARGLSLDDADDVAQKTWARLIALDRAGRLPYVEMPGLALRQARFLAASLRRDAKDHEGGVDLLVDERADPEERALARDRVARALAEIERLPPSAQAVFRRLLRDPPPTHASVAAEVGLSEQRVRQIACEVRARLRRSIAEDA